MGNRYCRCRENFSGARDKGKQLGLGEQYKQLARQPEQLTNGQISCLIGGVFVTRRSFRGGRNRAEWDVRRATGRT